MYSSLVVVASFLLMGLTSAKIVDRFPASNYHIALALCEESSTARIASSVTVNQLFFFFQSLMPKSELYKCGKLYERPLEDLQEVINTSKGNVCAKEKVDALEKFHFDYIVPSLSPNWAGASEKPIAPEPLRVFFMNYANQIADSCKDTLLPRLEDALARAKPGRKHETGLDRSLQELILPHHQVTNYDSFLLLWNQILASARARGYSYDLHIDSFSREKVIGLIKVQEASNAWVVQAKCHLDLRPIYSRTVLPVMRIIEMGYGTLDQESEQVVSGSEVLKNWYTITQVCEALIPINFYLDFDMKAGKTVLLKNPDTAIGLKRLTIVGSNDLGFDRYPLKLRSLIPSADDSSIVERVKNRIIARNRSLKQVVAKVFDLLKIQLAPKVDNFSLQGNTEQESGQEYMNQWESDIRSEIESLDSLEQLDTETRDLSVLSRMAGARPSYTNKLVSTMLMLFGLCVPEKCALQADQ